MIYLATDHRGFGLKEKIKEWLKGWGYQYEDMGAFEYNPEDDYPDFISKAAEKVSQDPENSKAIILGGSGQGEAIVANRHKGVRAAVFYGPSLGRKFFWYFFGGGYLLGRTIKLAKELEKVVKLSREHNDANILSLGIFFLDEDTAKRVIKLWLETPFSNEERHRRRINKIDS